MMNAGKQLVTYYGYDESGFVLAKADGSDYQSILDSDSEYIRALKFYFQANQMGLVDPESTTQNYDTLFAKFQEGQVLFSWWPWLGQAAFNTTTNLTEGKGFMLAPIQDQKSSLMVRKFTVANNLSGSVQMPKTQSESQPLLTGSTLQKAC